MPADVTGTLTINDTATPVSFSAPGQNALLTFTVTTTQLVTVRVTNNGVPGITTVSLLNGGTTITTWSSFDSGFNLPQQSLSPGTYTVKIDPAAQNTGTLSIQVTSP